MARDSIASPEQRIKSKPESTPQHITIEKPGNAPNPKIDSALQGLAAKLVNGDYVSGNVKVEKGFVQVFIRAKDLSGDHIKALKTMGIQVISSAHANQTILAKIRVEDLEKVAALDWVIKIEAPSF